MRIRRWSTVLLFGILTALLLTGCDLKMMYAGSSTKGHIKASYKLFTGTDQKSIQLESGDILTIDYKSEVDKGELSMKLFSPENELLQELPVNEEGNLQLEAEQDGKYKLKIHGDQAKGSFEVSLAKVKENDSDADK
ncbi:hypothetical protein [Paenibacillus donghaensis]|uniref:Lipoprotein n=1 Tax=Paenibacillus donghaensis TaxID=414771 RepID=A0A2Z2KQF9_9BACL|nr:hypothetical protein [Paenibacillus donghaensis]ASA26050.1 hypothetical protein B9T62_38285 [Paenibacillus donghaensis]